MKLNKQRCKYQLQIAKQNARIQLLEELALLQQKQGKSLTRCLNKLNKSIIEYFKGDKK